MVTPRSGFQLLKGCSGFRGLATKVLLCALLYSAVGVHAGCGGRRLLQTGGGAPPPPLPPLGPVTKHAAAVWQAPRVRAQTYHHWHCPRRCAGLNSALLLLALARCPCLQRQLQIPPTTPAAPLNLLKQLKWTWSARQAGWQGAAELPSRGRRLRPPALNWAPLPAAPLLAFALCRASHFIDCRPSPCMPLCTSQCCRSA